MYNQQNDSIQETTPTKFNWNSFANPYESADVHVALNYDGSSYSEIYAEPLNRDELCYSPMRRSPLSRGKRKKPEIRRVENPSSRPWIAIFITVITCWFLASNFLLMAPLSTQIVHKPSAVIQALDADEGYTTSTCKNLEIRFDNHLNRALVDLDILHPQDNETLWHLAGLWATLNCSNFLNRTFPGLDLQQIRDSRGRNHQDMADFNSSFEYGAKTKAEKTLNLNKVIEAASGNASYNSNQNQSAYDTFFHPYLSRPTRPPVRTRPKPFRSRSLLSHPSILWRYSFSHDSGVELAQIPPALAATVGAEYVAWDRARAPPPQQDVADKLPGSNVQNGAGADGHNTIKRIWIWGERCSCTTAITDLLLNNFDLPCEERDSEGVRRCVLGGLPWKHDFMRRADLTNQQNDTLHLHVSRHPYEWLASMRRNAFYANFHKGLRMRDFLTLQWMSVNLSAAEQVRLDMFLSLSPPVIIKTRLSTATGRLPWRPSFGLPHYHPPVRKGETLELLRDRDPDTGQRFPTVLAMRTAKLRDWVREETRLQHADRVACRDYMLDPSGFLEGLERTHGLNRKHPGTWNLDECVWHFGSCDTTQSGTRRSSSAKKLCGAQKRELYLGMLFMADFDKYSLAISNAWLDPELEAHFGYHLFNSMSAASVPYTEKTRCSVHGSCN